MDQQTLFDIAAIVSLPVWMGVIFAIARRQHRHWAWAALGLLQLLGLAVAVAWFFWIKPRKDGLSQLREQYARGEIGEEEYLRAMTRMDRAA